jgi:hypothetical protein
MKVLFLDIDGVLNSMRTAKAFDGYPWNAKSLENFDKVAIGLIQLLCEETGCFVVLSSTWRLGPNWKDLASQLSLPIIDRTPSNVTLSGYRGEEIKRWLEENPLVTQYAIVDDSTEILPEQLPYFVKTNAEDGLSYQNYLQLKELLK